MSNKKFDEKNVTRDDGGQFSEQSGGSADGSTAPASAPKPELTAREREDNSYAVMKDLGIASDSAEALHMINAEAGDFPSAESVNNAGFVEAGLVVDNGDGTFSITDAGKAFIAATETGDAKAASTIIEETRAKRSEPKNEQAKDDIATAMQETVAAKPQDTDVPKDPAPKNKPASAAKDPKKEKAQQQAFVQPAKSVASVMTEAQIADSQSTMRDLGVDEKSANILLALNSETGPQPTIADVNSTNFVNLGFVTVSNGTLMVTEAGRQFVEAAARKDTEMATQIARSAQRARTMKTLYAPLQKSDLTRTIVGIASTDTIDNQGGMWRGQAYVGDRVATTALIKAVPNYLQWGAVRTMHENVAAGTAINVEVIDNKLWLVAHVPDNDAWNKIVTQVYKGLSIGGKVLDAHVVTIDGANVREITELELIEISLVDRPANPDAEIIFYKRHQEESTPMKKGSHGLIIALQGARNKAELDGDLDNSALFTQAIALVLQASEASAMPKAEEAVEDIVPDDEASDPVTETSGSIALEDEELSVFNTKVAKAGKQLNGKNLEALKATAKAVLQMLANAGDQWAQSLLNAPTMPQDVQAMPDTSETIKLQHAVDALQKRVKELENAPAPMRVHARGEALDRDQNMVKALGAIDVRKKQELQRLVAIETNPTRLAVYKRQLAELQGE